MSNTAKNQNLTPTQKAANDMDFMCKWVVLPLIGAFGAAAYLVNDDKSPEPAQAQPAAIIEPSNG
jgi:hypothetical protein